MCSSSSPVVTEFSGKILPFNGHWHTGKVCSSPVSIVPGRWQRGWRHVGERFTDVNVVNRVPHGGGGVMVWAGISYRQRPQFNFIGGNLNAQRYREEILRPIVVPIIYRHHLMFQHDNARPHVARVCTQFLEAENVPVLSWPPYSPDMLPIEHVWDALDRRVRQRVPVPTNIQQLRTANSMRRRCVELHEANGGHSRY